MSGRRIDHPHAVSVDGKPIVGTVDAEDVAAYLTSWLDSNIFTDWDYDGSINTRDLLAFLNEWVAKPGCD